MINGLLNPGYVRFDGSKFVTDSTIQLTGPAGPPGPQGIPGANGTVGTNGQDAFTTLTSSFVQPTAGISHPFNISVVSSAPFAINQTIFIANGGYYFVNSVSPNSLNIYNLGYSGNASPGTTINSNALVTPAGIAGATGSNSYTTLTSTFTQPAVNSSVSISVVSSSWAANGQNIYINNGGYYTVSSIPTSTSIVITNIGYAGNITPGSTAGGIGNAVSPAGPVGPIVFDSVSTMSSTNTTNFPDGIKVMTSFPRAMTCILNKNSSVTPDNLRYFAATPSGIWARDIVIGSPSASEVPAWYVSPTGNDNNDGLSNLTPVQNIEEIQYRIGSQPIDGNTVGTVLINLLGDYNDGREYSFDFKFVHSGSLAFIGQKNVQATYTVSAVTSWDENAGTIGAYSLSGSPNLSSNVGMFARISASTNPSAVGRKTLIVSTPSLGVFNGSFIDQQTTLTAEPIVGDTIQIYTLTKLGGNVIVNSSPVVFNGGGGMYFQDLDIGVVGANHTTTIGSGSATFVACIVRGCDVQPGVNGCSLNICGTYEVRSYSFLTLSGCIMQSGAGGAILDMRGGASGNSYTRCWVYGGAMTVGHSSDGSGTFSTVGTFVSSNAGNTPGTDCVVVYNKSNLVIGGKFLLINEGSTANGFHVKPGGGVYYPTATLPVFSGTTPTTKFRIGSTTGASLGTGLRDTNSSAEMVPGDT